MAKYVLALAALCGVAVAVKTATNGINEKLAAARNPPPAKADPNQPGVVPPGNGDAVTLVPFEDPLGYFRAMTPGTPAELGSVDRTALYGIGRMFRLSSDERKLRFVLYAEFVGGDEPNTPRQTLTWIAKKDTVLLQRPDLFEKVRFSRPAPGVEAADYEHEWRGNGARASRVRQLLVKKWLYTAAVHGLPDGIDGADVDAFFESFAPTEQALAHPEGGDWRP
jgi:hypothetical protein